MERFRIYKLLKKIVESDHIPTAQLESKLYFKSTLNSLIDAKAIAKEQVRRGSWQYKVCKPNFIKQLISAQYSDCEEKPDKISASDAVTLSGDGHKSNYNPHEDITVRIIGSGAVITNKKTGKKLDYTSLAELGGAITLRLDDWAVAANRICTVENHQFFWEANSVVDADLFLYTAGQFSDSFVEWLASDNVVAGEYIHAGDYDPAGLMMYMRLYRAVADIELFIPDDLDNLIKASRKSRLNEQERYINELTHTDVDVVKNILSMCIKYGKTLDQEGLLNDRF